MIMYQSTDTVPENSGGCQLAEGTLKLRFQNVNSEIKSYDYSVIWIIYLIYHNKI